MIHCHGSYWERSGVRPLTIRRTALDASKSGRIRFFHSAISDQLASKPKLDKNEKQFVYTHADVRRVVLIFYRIRHSQTVVYHPCEKTSERKKNNPIRRLIILSWNFPLWRCVCIVGTMIVQNWMGIEFEWNRNRNRRNYQEVWTCNLNILKKKLHKKRWDSSEEHLIIAWVTLLISSWNSNIAFKPHN